MIATIAEKKIVQRSQRSQRSYENQFPATVAIAIIWKAGFSVVCEDNSQIQSLAEELIVGDLFECRIIILFGRGLGGGDV